MKWHFLPGSTIKYLELDQWKILSIKENIQKTLCCQRSRSYEIKIDSFTYSNTKYYLNPLYTEHKSQVMLMPRVD